MGNTIKNLISSLVAFIGLIAASVSYAAGLQPEAPTNVVGTLNNGVATLTWDVPTSDDAIAGYNIYINNQYETTVAGNEYSTDIDQTTLSAFTIVAFDQIPRLYSPSSETLFLPDNLVPSDLTVPPSTPTELSGDVSGTTISLRWEPSTDDEKVSGYNVYRDNRYLTTVSDAAYSGFNEADASHSWTVVAFDIRNNFSPSSERIVLPDPGNVDTTIAPSVPMDLEGQENIGDVDTLIILSWQPSNDDQSVAGYNIYRNQQYVATRFDTEYIDTVPSGSSNGYSVVAFDSDGNFSTNSEILTLPVGSAVANPGTPPSVPTGLQAQISSSNGRTNIELSWQPSSSAATVSGYNVYRNNQYLATVRDTNFQDSVEAGSPNSYSVAAFDGFENFSAQSAPVSALGNTNQPPFFSDLSNQTLSVGQPWELLLQPVDIDGGVSGIIVSDLPNGAQNRDNFDGTRSLVWVPSNNDIGSYALTITAFDVDNTDVRTSQNITVNVVQNDTVNSQTLAINIAPGAYNLQEGDATGVDIPFSLVQADDRTENVTVSFESNHPDDAQGITAQFDSVVLQPGDTNGVLNLRLAVDVLPLLNGSRQFSLLATIGNEQVSRNFTVAITPVARDDVYLLIGQSNMVGFSEDNAKQSFAGGLDEPSLRIRQANVIANGNSRYPSAASYSDASANFSTPRFITAEDPLHEPADPETLTKSGTRIGMGLSFAKSALPATTRNIVLVPAAWSGSGFCADSSIDGHWNATETQNSSLGNTLLFDRALARVNATLEQTGGILRGIVWHQGEADAKPACAPLYEQNLINLIEAFRSRTILDVRGSDARGPQAKVPFILGTQSRGNDERGDFSIHDDAKTQVDNVHRNISNLVPHSAVFTSDDLIPTNGFPCGEGSCVHYGASSLRQMGVRAYEALERAAR